MGGKKHRQGSQSWRCSTKYCRGRRTECHAKCPKCRSRDWRKNNPLRAAWRIIKDRARRKKRQFDLPFESFKAMAEASGYPNGRAIHCDRIDPTRGYTLDNIQFITGSENSIKGNIERRTEAYRLFFGYKKVTQESEGVAASDSSGVAASDSGEISELAASDSDPDYTPPLDENNPF